MRPLPTTYAHYRFGNDVVAGLPVEDQITVQGYRFLFDFGVHGPDLLFYYKPLAKNRVNQTGYRDHERTGRDFFSQAIETARTGEAPDKARAYLYGVLCHFALDRECHPYVGKKEKEQVSHSLIEASFDRFLMQKDGLDPLTHNVTAHLHPDRESAKVIAPFFPPLTSQEILDSEKSMVFYLKALIATGFKRSLLLGAMKTVGAEKLGDMFIPYSQDPRTQDSDLRLYRLYEEAIPLAVELISQARACLEGAPLETLGPGFDHTFGET